MNLDKILMKDKSLLIENYFELQEEAEKLYGPNTIILMEIGSFYEIYQYDNIGKAQEVSKILNILLTKKNKKIQETNITNPYLCGIPSVTLDKHLDRLMSEEKWTILIVKQKGTPPNITRYIDRILSPGTSIEHVSTDEYNFIASIYIGKNKNDIYYSGMSMIDLSIGKSFVYENFGTSEDKLLPIDEVEQIVRTHNIKEMVFVFEEEIEQKIINDINPRDIPYTAKTEKEVKKFIDISFQNKILEEIFNAKGFFSAIEDLDLERMPLATNSLTVLLSFIIEHNKTIAENLSKPEKINSSKFMYLGNNPIQQLNIHTDKGISVSKIINKGLTAVGRRFILEQLLNPLYDKQAIEKRINTTKKFMEIEDYTNVSKNLKEVYDIERIWRKVELGTLSPFELHNLIHSFEKIISIHEEIKVIDISEETVNKIKNMIKEVKNTFEFESMSLFNLQNIDKSFIKQGVSEELDSIQRQYEESLSIIQGIKTELEKITEVSLGKTETEGYYYEITKKKYEENKNEIDKVLSEYGEVSKRSLKNSHKFFTSEVKELSIKNVALYSNLISKVKEIFSTFVENNIYTEENETAYKEIVRFVCYIDFYLNNIRLCDQRNYCIPEIIDSKENFYEVKELRHPIVETVEENGIFIPNDIILGTKELATIDTKVLYNKENEMLNGFLLYGINSAGKTVLTKSIGISIILAQAGIPVPATSMRFTIKDSLFTRIAGSDNLQKGLSTFAIEMLELKNIFNRATSNSIVLGDEISHGTETISGMSIVASTIIELVEINSLFVLSTHLHQLEDIRDIKELKNISSAHLSIKYDEVKDLLIYDRKLKPGSGSSVYGLEFAKSLKLPEKFIQRAYGFRDMIAPDLSEEKRAVLGKKSKYNSKVLITSCAVCGAAAEETHHIKERASAENGFVGSVRLNHKHNLLPLCKECHDKVHNGILKINGFMQTSEGIVLGYEEVKNEN